MIDYMKIIDVLERLFGAQAKSTLNAMHKTFDVFDVTVSLAGNRTVTYRMFIKQFSAEILIDKSALASFKLERWLSNLEFELEQSLLVNVKLDTHDEKGNYRLIINI